MEMLGEIILIDPLNAFFLTTWTVFGRSDSREGFKTEVDGNLILFQRIERRHFCRL